MKKLVMVVLASSLAVATKAEDLTVAAGETVNITADASYDTVTVNGTLNLSAKLTFTNLYIAEGSGATGTMNISGAGYLAQYNDSSDKSIYIGHNGGNGTLVFSGTKETAAGYLVLGHGGGESTLEVGGKYYQGWSVRKQGAGVGHIQFNGGYLKLSSDFFVVEEGTLNLESLNSKDIAVRPYNSVSKNFASGKGKLVVKGAAKLGLYSLLTAEYAAKYVVKLQGPEGGLDLSEFTGNMSLDGSATIATTYKLMQDDFINHPNANLQLNHSQILDLNGHQAAFKGFSCWSDTASFSLVNSASAAAEISVSDNLNSKVSIGENINIRKVGDTTLTWSGELLAGSLILDAGTFAFSQDAEVQGDITQSGSGLLSIASGKTLTFSGELWSSPAFDSSSQGTVKVASSEMSTLDVQALSLTGPLTVASGKLVVGELATTTSDRYFRLTLQDNYNSGAEISTSYTPKDLVILAEFKLYDADGNRLNAGLKAAAAGTAAKDLQPGYCCYAEAYAEGMSGVADMQDVPSGVANLFDTYATSCVYFKDLNWVEGSDDNSPRVILFRLAADQTAEVAKYQLQSSNKCYIQSGNSRALVPTGNVTKWKLESSPDGIRWQTLDTREQRLSDDQVKSSNTNYKNGPYSLAEDFVRNADSVTFAAGTSVTVLPGASLEVFADTCELASLTTDCSLSGEASVSGCTLASSGNLYLTNVTEPFMRLPLPLTLTSMTNPEAFAEWSVYVNGTKETDSKLKCNNGLWTLVRKCGMFILFK